MNNNNQSIQEAFIKTKHQLELEGFFLSKQDKKYMIDVLNGKIKRSELIKKLSDESNE